MTTFPRMMITPGEPVGIGPDIVLQIAEHHWPAELCVVCDPDLLIARAEHLSLPIQLIETDLTQPARLHEPGILKIVPVKMASACKIGKLNPDNAPYVIQCLEMAVDICLQRKANALVTGPVQKSVINEAGISFTGHTEFLAQRCAAPQVLMLFVVNALKVALVTTHVPLAQVSPLITTERLLKVSRLLSAELQNLFHIPQPKIAVCGLNPHAGENGHLGTEEMEVISPTLALLRQEGIDMQGPFPADTIFTEKYLKMADAVLAMYHDQALPVVKYIGFSHAVNVTLGLPIIRTSVDHGTALDIAGTKQADPGSLIAALRLAIELSDTARKRNNF